MTESKQSSSYQQRSDHVDNGSTSNIVNNPKWEEEFGIDSCMKIMREENVNSNNNNNNNLCLDFNNITNDFKQKRKQGFLLGGERHSADSKKKKLEDQDQFNSETFSMPKELQNYKSNSNETAKKLVSQKIVVTVQDCPLPSSVYAATDINAVDWKRIAVIATSRSSGGFNNATDRDWNLAHFVNNNVVNIHYEFCMVVEGITCVHCVTVIELALKGCVGNTPLIVGIIDAVVDFTSKNILVKINNINDLETIASKAKQNLASLGYTARLCPVEESFDDIFAHDLHNCAANEKKIEVLDNIIFDWNSQCSCSSYKTHDSSDKCTRHTKIKHTDWEVFQVHI